MEQDLMREISLSVDYLSVMICTMLKMPLWFAGLLKTEDWGFLLTFSFRNCNKNLPRMLGYSYGQHTTQSQFGPVSSTFGMDNVQCTGNETSLLDCPHLTVDDCGSYEGAGVICSNTGRLQASWARGWSASWNVHNIVTRWTFYQISNADYIGTSISGIFALARLCVIKIILKLSVKKNPWQHQQRQLQPAERMHQQQVRFRWQVESNSFN